MDNFKEFYKGFIAAYKQHKGTRLFTAGISGIDGSGKGYIAKLLQQQLEDDGYRVANINIDPWQNPIPVRLQYENAAANFYARAFRWDDFFQQLISPLQQNKGIELKTMLIRTYADEYYPFVYKYHELDILLIEGIFLFQPGLIGYYDWKVWIDCSFEMALQRARQRNIERLSDDQLIRDYNTYYFPAQRLHFDKDHPQQIADQVFVND